jgi:hypothetical protein
VTGGNRGTATVGGGVIAGTVGEVLTSGTEGTVGGAVLVGGGVGAVVVVVSTTSGVDEARSTAQTAGPLRVVPTDSSDADAPIALEPSSTALANTIHRPCCEIETLPFGSASASSSIAWSVVDVPSDDSTRIASPRR